MPQGGPQPGIPLRLPARYLRIRPDGKTSFLQRKVYQGQMVPPFLTGKTHNSLPHRLFSTPIGSSPTPPPACSAQTTPPPVPSRRGGVPDQRNHGPRRDIPPAAYSHAGLATHARTRRTAEPDTPRPDRQPLPA